MSVSTGAVAGKGGSATTDGLASPGNVIVFKGLDKNTERAFASSNSRVRIGCLLLVFAFCAQLGATVMPEYMARTATGPTNKE